MVSGRLPRLTAGLAALLSSGGIAAGYQIAAAPPASAVIMDYTWTGQGTDPNWSTAANWDVGSPSADSTVGTLTFPDLGSCDNSVNACDYSLDDLGGDVTANGIVFNTAQDSYYIANNNTEAITLGSGGVSVNGPDPATGQGPLETLGLPLTLSADQSWSIDNGALSSNGGISGSSTLDVSVSNGGGLDLSGSPAIELGDVSVTGQDAGQSGGSGAANNGYLNLGDLNDTNGHAVNVTDIQVNGPGGVGALSSAGSQIYVGNSDLSYAAPGSLSATSVTLDGKTEVDFSVVGNNDVGGTDFTQLASSGSVDLGGAQIRISPSYTDAAGNPACLTPQAGHSWTLVTGTAITGEFSDQGVLIPDGGIVQMDDCNGNAGSGAHVRINYSQTAVTATPLDTTTTTLTAAPASPQTGQSTVLTATVSSPTTPAQGTVSFLDQDGSHPIPGCQDVPVTGSARTATCTTSWTEAGENGLGAEFTPAAGANVTSSFGAIPFTVRVPGATSTQSGTSGTPGGAASAADGNVSATASHGEGTVVVSQYSSDPAPAPTFSSAGKYFDVRLNSGSTFTSVTVNVSGMPSGGGLYWWNASASKWQPVVGDPGPSPVSGDPTTDVVTFTANSSPNLSQLTGTVFGISNASASGPAPAGPGYRMAASDGGVFDFNEPFYGSTGGVKLTQPIVGMANAAAGKGYYLVAKDGGVFAFGPGSRFQGSTGGVKLTQPIVAMAVDPATGGYWLVASDGGVFAFNAPFYGSTGGVKLTQPIVGMAAAPGGKGYYLVAKDGGIFAFGPGARFQGSTGGARLVQPVVGMSVDPLTGGYRLVASDGGIFSFNAPFKGSTGGVKLTQPIVGMTTDPVTGGYWLVASDGGIFAFDAPFDGSTGGVKLVKPIVAMAAG